ncbi:MAG: DUF115 domain-containing protein [Candidatus Nanoarchaeia archaeon]|nr:DUF115 domain-containing protein [Candidatus Nanoarchaeia archaeon]
MENREKSKLFNSDSYNASTLAAQTIIEEWNAGHNLYRIEKLVSEGRCRDIGQEPKKDGAPCFIIGSGGSLDIALPKLVKWEGGIICTPTQALTFIYHGIEPDYLFIIDPYDAYQYMDGFDWSKTKTKLIAPPTCDTSMIEKWPNEILLYVQDIARRDAFFTNTMQHMYCKREGFRGARLSAHVFTKLSTFACSPPIAMLGAAVLGYGNIFLAGCDFGYTYNKNRYTDYTVIPLSIGYECPYCNYTIGNDDVAGKNYYCPNCGKYPDSIEWEKHEHPFSEVENDKEHGPMVFMSNNGVPTLPLHNFYKKAMISAWRKFGQSVFTTDKGIITEIPYLDLDYVIQKQGKHIKEFNKQERSAMAEDYLASVDSYVIEANEISRGGEQLFYNVGLIFIDCPSPDPAIRRYLIGMDQVYSCMACGHVQALLDKCPTCGKNIEDIGKCDGNIGLAIKDGQIVTIPCDHVITRADLKDHSQENCPKCQAHGMVKTFMIDIEGNMERIMKLYNKYHPAKQDAIEAIKETIAECKVAEVKDEAARI